MNMTKNQKLVITVLSNKINGYFKPYYTIDDIEYELENALIQGGIYEDLKKVPSSQQIHRTLQSLIAEGLVLTTILPLRDDSDIMIDYYVLISEYEAARNKLIGKCFSLYSQVDPAKFESDIFHQLGFFDLNPEELPSLLLSAQLSMEKKHPDISKAYFEEQFRKMKECIAWVNDVIPFPTHKPHSPLVTEKAKHLSNLDPDFA